MTKPDSENPRGIGAPVLRKEDWRHLNGRARFVADIPAENALEAAILRSPVSHGILHDIRPGPLRGKGLVFTAADFPEIQPIRATPRIPGFKSSDFPPFATDRVRYAGQPVAICLAASRAEAEDIARNITLDIDPLPAVVDSGEAVRNRDILLHEAWGDNQYIERVIEGGDIDRARNDAEVVVTGEYRLNRHVALPLECRAALALWRDHRDELELYLSTQGPHIMRVGIAACLGLPERSLRVISPDVGGGFGSKNRMMPEEIMVCAAALKTRKGVRWIEDRSENITANNQAREHSYRITAYADRTGRILGIDAEVTVDAGAYSIWPGGPFLETGMAARNLTGPYRIRALHVRTRTVATNKPPLGPYRGVARPGACFAIERTLDEVARRVGRDPFVVRRENMVRASDMPYTTVAGMRFDNGNYPRSLEMAAEAARAGQVRTEQSSPRADGRLLGIGYASYSEQTAHGAQEWKIRGTPVIPAFETATVRMHSDGTAELLVAIHSHGQGMETTLAQVACQELGLDIEDVVVRYGDTGVSPYGNGTFASRSMVMAGGAAAHACRALAGRLRRIGSHLMQCEESQVELRDGRACAGDASVPIPEIARIAHVRQDLLPDGMMPTLEETKVYEPGVTSGVFSYATHAAVVLVDPETGEVSLRDYAVAEDCGTMVNPVIVDGQIAGGTLQGIGTALFEEIPFDGHGQPLATTLADYCWPGPTSIPRLRLAHLVTPADGTEYGMKGMGEGGAIAPPAAIANAIRDAFTSVGQNLEVNVTPLTPRRLYQAILAART